jgi:hypothetical protein
MSHDGPKLGPPHGPMGAQAKARAPELANA